MKTNYKHILLGVMILVGLIGVISSTSACMVMNYHITIHGSDYADKIIEIENNKLNISEDAYKQVKNKNTKIIVHKKYQVKNKEGKTISNSENYYEIKNFKKNKINFTNNNSSDSPIKKVKKHKTNFTDNNLNSKYTKNRFMDKFDKKVISTEFNLFKCKNNDFLNYDSQFWENISFMEYSIRWKDKDYTKFINMKYNITHEHDDNSSILMKIMKVFKRNKTYLTDKNNTTHLISLFILKTLEKSI